MTSQCVSVHEKIVTCNKTNTWTHVRHGTVLYSRYFNCQCCIRRRTEKSYIVAGKRLCNITDTVFKLEIMNPELLIELVRNHPPLYDVFNQYYTDTNVKQHIWEKIGQELNVDGKWGASWRYMYRYSYSQWQHTCSCRTLNSCYKYLTTFLINSQNTYIPNYITL